MKTLGCVVSVVHLVLLLDTTSLSSAQQSCSQGGLRTWPTQSFGEGGGGKIPEDTQVILPRYRLTCNGNVTVWAVDLSGRGEYRVALQVWRQSSDCYGLVGSNILSTSISGGSLVTLTPTSQITVQPSDVVGFIVIDAPTSNSQGVNLHTDIDSTAIMILATSTTVDDTTLCILTTSTQAPVISVSVLEATSTIIVVPTSTPHPFPPSTTTMTLSTHNTQVSLTLDPLITPTMKILAPTLSTLITVTTVMKESTSLTDSGESSTPMTPTLSTVTLPITSYRIVTMTPESKNFTLITDATSPSSSSPSSGSGTAGQIGVPLGITLIALTMVTIVTAVIIVGTYLTLRKKEGTGITEHDYGFYDTPSPAIPTPLEHSIQMKQNDGVYGINESHACSRSAGEIEALTLNEAYGVNNLRETLQPITDDHPGYDYDYVNEGTGPCPVLSSEDAAGPAQEYDYVVV